MPERRSGPEQLNEGRWSLLAQLGPVLLAVLGCLASVALCHLMHKGEKLEAQTLFQLEASKRIAQVQNERVAALEKLQAVALLFDSSHEVLREEFHTFTHRSFESHPALRAFLWIERVPHEGRFESHVTFVEGELGLVRPGFEQLPAVADLLAHTEWDLEPPVSAPLQLEGAEGVHVLAALPILFHEREEPRYGEMAGHVVLILDPGRLLEVEAVGEGMRLADVKGLRLEDVTGTVPVLLGGELLEGEPSYSAPYDIGGRRWRFTCVAPPDFASSRTTLWPWITLLLGLALTSLAVYALRVVTSRKRIQELVDRRTGEVMQSYATLAHEADERRQATLEAHEAQEQLRQILDLVPSQIYVKDRHGRMLIANQATADAYGTTVKALTLPATVDFNTSSSAELAPGAGEDSVALERDRDLMASGKSVIDPAWPFVDAEGRRRLLHMARIPCRVGSSPALLHVATDVTERRQAEDVLRGQTRILAELARGTPPEEVLLHLVSVAEGLVPGMRCSLLFLSADRKHLAGGLAPSLPEEYSRAIEGLEVGPLAGSCGAAVHLGRRFVVKDVMEHPNWAPYRELARRAEIRACWSEPVRAVDGEILGTFAMYYSEPREPEPYEEHLIESMAFLAGIAIERGRRKR